MPDRTGKILRWACLLLAALLAYRLAHIAPHVNPLRGVVIPELPALASDKTNAPVAAKEGTNSAKATASTTNKPVKLAGGTNAPTTNAAAEPPAGLAPPFPATESAAHVKAVEKNGTNTVVASVSTNGSNAVPALGTNSAAGTNAPSIASTSGTNATNLAKANRKSGTASRTRMGMPMNGGGVKLAELPPETKARINRVYESEILGQVMHPMPAGLMGIAGDVAFLRSASGQTGLVKEGESVGDLKLLRIGINRVLVEENGQKKEFTIFDGYGSTSLLTEEGKK